jgi:hypothetical protein
MSRASQGLFAPPGEAHETLRRSMHAGNRLVPEPAVLGGAEG